MNNSCSICFEKLKIDDSYQKWKCSHRFHKSCVESWNTSCPLCRTTELRHELQFKNKRNILDLERMKSIHNLVPVQYQNIYKEKWNDKRCIEKNHSLWLFHPFGVIGICEDCNTIQAFNSIH